MFKFYNVQSETVLSVLTVIVQVHKHFKLQQ